MKLPVLLRTIWRHWRALAVKLGHFNGLVLLTVFYWTVIGVVGALFRLAGQDPLGRRQGRASTYHPKALRGGDRREYEHLY